MKDKTALFISCSEHYHHRFCVVDDYFRSCGYKTTYITSDFDHASKSFFVCQVAGCVQIHALPYKKNLSIARILSHFRFARDLYRYLEEQPEEPDVIIALLPPNFLAHFLAKYKKRHPNVKLIFDIFDLWPETFPSNKLEKVLSPLFSVWAWLRNHSLPKADWVLTECDYFRQRLGLGGEKASTIYLCLDAADTQSETVCLREDAWDFCYLGAINNVIGISEICHLIRSLTKIKPVTLHIIGAGERQQEFMDSVEAAGAKVVYYGTIFDQKKKQEIINRCHFGLNVISSNACIGLTMKSVDYFRCGLPIINNVPADTADLIKEYHAGVQVDADGIEYLLDMSVAENLQIRENVAKLFEEKFSKAVVYQEYRQLLETLL